MNRSLATAAGLGAVTGLRSMTGAALVARELSTRGAPSRWRRRSHSTLERWLTDRKVARALQVMAAGEILVDKLPGAPDRVAPASLAARAAVGAILGAAVAGDERRGAGAAVGAVAAIAACFAGWWLRREAGRATHLPDAALAVAEDAVAVAAARELAAEV